jgi:hypothetical protein
VELDVRAKPEGPDEPVSGDGPRGGEGGLDVASLAERNEALIEEPHRHQLGRRRRVRGVETRRDARNADVEIAGRRRDDVRDGEQQDDGDEERRAHWATTAPLPPRGLGRHRRPL